MVAKQQLTKLLHSPKQLMHTILQCYYKVSLPTPYLLGGVGLGLGLGCKLTKKFQCFLCIYIVSIRKL